ncbi:MAG: PEP-CTERM sorting domain-containing protein, partial [Candidatus Aminicenantales bacterium]
RPDHFYSAPEPAAMALLGAGLVSLGLFAKRKLGKKS